MSGLAVGEDRTRESGGIRATGELLDIDADFDTSGAGHRDPFACMRDGHADGTAWHAWFAVRCTAAVAGAVDADCGRGRAGMAADDETQQRGPDGQPVPVERAAQPGA